MTICDQCGVPIVQPKTGRRRRFCSGACRVANHRVVSEVKPVPHGVPEALLSRDRWILHRQKRPMAIGGWWASINDSSVWVSYREAVDALPNTRADGVGFILNGDGVVCLDLDGCVVDGVIDPLAQAFIGALGTSYVEFSPSRTGLHIWGFSDLERGRVLAGGALKVEMYPNGRFITWTGDAVQNVPLAPLNVANALRLVE
jgi:primase-polymerase (primpol)-like protein